VATGEQWVSTEVGQHLRSRRTKDTKPEVQLRSAVHAAGLRFRKHQSVAPRCTPDFVLRRWHIAVFVDGCFWHGCPDHSPRFRGPNAHLWEEKLAANRARDARNTATALEAGWRVVRVWECEVRRDVAAAAQVIRRAAVETRSDSDGVAGGGAP